MQCMKLRWNAQAKRSDRTWSWSSKLLVFQEQLLQQYEVLTQLWQQVWGKKFVPISRMFFLSGSSVSCLLHIWKPQYQAATEYQSCLYTWGCDPELVSFTTLNLDGLSIPMGNCPCTTFSFSAQPTAIPRRFCCMHWVLIRILQNTGSEIIAVLLSPLIQPSLPVSAASACCRTESTHCFREIVSLTLGARCGGVVYWSLLQTLESRSNIFLPGWKHSKGYSKISWERYILCRNIYFTF